MQALHPGHCKSGNFAKIVMTYLLCLKIALLAWFTYISKRQSGFVISWGFYFHKTLHTRSFANFRIFTVIFHAFDVICWYFFSSKLLFKNLSGTLSERQTVWIQIRTNILSVLIWVQTVCKGYQQMTKVTACKQREWLTPLISSVAIWFCHMG